MGRESEIYKNPAKQADMEAEHGSLSYFDSNYMSHILRLIVYESYFIVYK